MKLKHLIGILVILLIILGVFLMSPYSPLNKTSLNSKSIKIPSGYTVTNSTDHSLSISNNTDNITIYSLTEKNVNDAVKKYKEKHNKTFNITQKSDTVGDIKVIRTKAAKYNTTNYIYRTWFAKKGKVYNIQTYSNSPALQKTVDEIISSM